MCEVEWTMDWRTKCRGLGNPVVITGRETNEQGGRGRVGEHCLYKRYVRTIPSRFFGETIATD